MYVQARLPISIGPVSADPEDFEAWADTNRRLLDGIALIDERPTDEGAASPELQRIHARLDLLLLMMAELVPNAGRPGEPLTVALGNDGVRLPEGIAQASLEPVLLRLWIHPLLAVPVRWPVVVVGDEDGLLARFEPMPESLEQAWERELFRRHRREIGARRDARR